MLCDSGLQGPSPSLEQRARREGQEAEGVFALARVKARAGQLACTEEGWPCQPCGKCRAGLLGGNGPSRSDGHQASGTGLRN